MISSLKKVSLRIQKLSATGSFFYSAQVDLMTTEHYNVYYKQAIESKKKYYMGIRMAKKDERVVEKGKLIS